MDRKLTRTEQNLNLAATYIKINEEGRVILDTVIQKLLEIQPEIETRAEKCLKKYGKSVKEYM